MIRWSKCSGEANYAFSALSNGSTFVQIMFHDPGFLYFFCVFLVFCASFSTFLNTLNGLILDKNSEISVFKTKRKHWRLALLVQYNVSVDRRLIMGEQNFLNKDFVKKLIVTEKICRGVYTNWDLHHYFYKKKPV